MKSKRLQALCEFLSVDDKLIDIGTDHAYIPIEMSLRGAQKILATDIHEGALKRAQKNIQNAHLEKQIETQLSDGLESICTKDYNTILIAGMGALNIEHILSSKEKLKSISKIVLQANNDWAHLRVFMKNLGYALKEEKKVYEKKHYYILMKYEKGEDSLSQEEILFGLYHEHDKDYYSYLIQQYEDILKKIPDTNSEQKELSSLLKKLKKYVREKEKHLT